MTTSLQAHRIETTLTQDGSLTLDHLPFRAGESVEVIVLTNAPISSAQNRDLLHGTVTQYLDPFEPVAEANEKSFFASFFSKKKALPLTSMSQFLKRVETGKRFIPACR